MRIENYQRLTSLISESLVFPVQYFLCRWVREKSVRKAALRNLQKKIRQGNFFIVDKYPIVTGWGGRGPGLVVCINYTLIHNILYNI